MRKRILVIAAVLVALPILALTIAAVALPSERVARMVAERAQAKLGREVTIGDVGLSVLPFGVSLDALTVAGPTAGDDPVLSVERFLLRPKLLPLLRGRVLIDELHLTGPNIRIAIDTAGVSNLPELASDSA